MSLLTRLAGYILAAAMLLPGQEAAVPLGYIEGTVTEVPGGAPAANIPIDIMPAGGNAVTDAAGRYVVKDLKPGRYAVVARGRVEGYGLTPSGTLAGPRWVQLASGQRLTVNLEVKKEIVLAGRVLHGDRNPVANARVAVWSEGFFHGLRRFGPVGSTGTNDLGEFRISGLAGGRYYIEAAPPVLRFRKRLEKAERKPVMSTVWAFYPNVIDPEAASPISVEPGERREGNDLILEKRETYCVDTVVPPGDGVSLVLEASAGPWSRIVGGGGFQGGDEVEICGVPPGQYRLTASTWGGQGFTAYGAVDVAVGERHASVGTVPLTPGLQVPGKITVADARAEDPLPARIYVELVSIGRKLKGEDVHTEVGSSGDFTIPAARADHYWLRVTGLREGFYVREARMGAIDARREPVRPGSGELTIVLGQDGASVSGSVADGDRELPPDTVVVLAPAELPATGVAGLVRTQPADQNGQFQFKGVAPGEYRLLAFTGLLPGEGENPGFLRGHMTKAEELTARPRETKSVKLPLLRAR